MPTKREHEEWRQLVYIRDSGLCQWHLWKENKRHAGTDPHHIQPRGGGGKDVPHNGILLCREIHNAVHAGRIHNAKEELRGILRKRGVIK